MSNPQACEIVLNQLIAHPEKHWQYTFWCGTAGCVAGWACQLYKEGKIHLTDEEWQPKDSDFDLEPEWLAYFKANHGGYFERGQLILGLTTDEASFLFNGGLEHDTCLYALKALMDGLPILDSNTGEPLF